MTLREYLDTCDEFEKTVILANIARRYPNYDTYGLFQKQQIRKEVSKLLDTELSEIKEV